jgi:hypothetical protein
LHRLCLPLLPRVLVMVKSQGRKKSLLNLVKSQKSISTTLWRKAQTRQRSNIGVKT